MRFPDFFGGQQAVEGGPHSPADPVKQASHTKTAGDPPRQDDALERLPQGGQHQEQAQNSHKKSHLRSTDRLFSRRFQVQHIRSSLFVEIPAAWRNGWGREWTAWDDPAKTPGTRASRAAGL